MTTAQRNILYAVLITTFLSAIEITIVSTAMPTIISDLGGFELLSWVYAVYLLTSAASVPIWGKLSDLFGRKKLFQIGVLIFLLASTLCALSQSMLQLIVFRFFQGIGAGAVNTLSFSIIADVFDFEQRAKAQSWVSSIWGIAGIFGPLAGGMIVDLWTWHGIFLLNLPFGIAAMWMIGRSLQETVQPRNVQIDYGGSITFTIGLTALLYALLSFGGGESDANGLSLGMFTGLLLTSAVFLVLFVLIERKHPEPMLPLPMLRQRGVLVPNVSGFISSFILIALNAYFPLWIQKVLHLGATYSGMTLTPMSISWLLGSILCARLVQNRSLVFVSAIGGAFVAAGCLPLVFLQTGMPNSILIGIIFTIGIGFGMISSISAITVQSSVPRSNRGAAGSTVNLSRTLGQTIGIAVFGAIFNQTVANASPAADETAAIAAGIQTVFLAVVLISLLLLVSTFYFPKEAKYKTAEAEE